MATLIARDLDFADAAPIIVEHVGVLDATTAEVWAAILDYERWAVWFPRIESCRATSDPATGVGSTREVVLEGGQRVVERFIAWDEEACWAFTATDAPPVFTSLVERVTIRRLGPRLTEVTYRMAIEPKRPLAPLVKLARVPISKVLKAALRNLNAEIADRRAAAPVDEVHGVDDHGDGDEGGSTAAH